MARYFICGTVQVDDVTVPEVVPELPPRTRTLPNGRVVTGTPDWMSTYEFPTDERACVWADLTDAEFAELAYDKDTNRNGFDWLEVADDGTVIVNAP